MAYGVVHKFAGATKAQYEASVAAVHPPNGLPEGQTLHFAGPSEDGWIIVATLESKEVWEKFRDGVLIPAMTAGIEGGFAAPPEEIGFQIDYRVEA